MDAGGLINSDVPTMLYLLLKTIKLDTRVGFSNMKYKIEKATQANFCNNVKNTFDDM